MNSAINLLVQSIVKKNSLAECSVSELQRLTTQYPYFGPVQFLLARKLKEDNSPLYGKQSQKAILYFRDDLWFDYVTNGKNNAIITTPVGHEIVSVTHEETVQEEVEEKTIEPIVETAPVAETFYTEPAHEPEPIEIEPISSATEETYVEEEVVEPVQEPEPIEVKPEPVVESIIVEEPIARHEEKTKAPVEYDDSVGNTSEPPIQIPQLKIEPFDPAKAKFTFEPYHTVDYFASQGIKFKEEEKPKDRFDKQLKSFTQWLKTLKKGSETEQTAAAPPAIEDKKVTQMAEHSLADREVVTEAMADVWEQQGNHQRAIETYHKLSLLNPSKSAYFAAKIEQLKRQ